MSKDSLYIEYRELLRDRKSVSDKTTLYQRISKRIKEIEYIIGTQAVVKKNINRKTSKSFIKMKPQVLVYKKNS